MWLHTYILVALQQPRSSAVFWRVAELVGQLGQQALQQHTAAAAARCGLRRAQAHSLVPPARHDTVTLGSPVFEHASVQAVARVQSVQHVKQL